MKTLNIFDFFFNNFFFYPNLLVNHSGFYDSVSIIPSTENKSHSFFNCSSDFYILFLIIIISDLFNFLSG